MIFILRSELPRVLQRERTLHYIDPILRDNPKRVFYWIKGRERDFVTHRRLSKSKTSVDHFETELTEPV